MPDNSPLKPIRDRADGRRSLLVYMDAGLIKELKKAAVDEDRNAYEIVEEATRKWLEGRANDKSSGGHE
ncbi:hypothetical protein [Devosia sp. 919]|uniref:hypothetical protein n=1 Tax=Devosia sp. 919 TaxID=2726065 RepID=UPI0015540C5F|nr:hypothetical protein [Devosia sp. 919]